MVALQGQASVVSVRFPVLKSGNRVFAWMLTGTILK